MLQFLAESLLIFSAASQADFQKIESTPYVFAVLVKE